MRKVKRMNRTARLVSCLGMVLLLSSCASGMKFTEANPKLAPQNQELGRIFFYRTTIAGAAVQPDVKLNGEVVGTAKPSGFFYVDRPAGNYEVITSTEVDRKLSFVLDKGETRFVRFGISFGFFVGHVYPELVDNVEGLKEIQDCRYAADDGTTKKTATAKEAVQKTGQ